MRDAFKKTIAFILFIGQTYAVDLSVIIDNQSSCDIDYNNAISKSYVPSAPNHIKPHSQEKIDFNINQKTMDHIILEYFVQCHEPIMSGFLGIKTEKQTTSMNFSKYLGNIDSKVYISIDSKTNFLIKDA
ncbi:MAG: hypothetical protein P8L77_06285 [Gammaproteobacteria bacterium]|nr:hypothetical protein [Gammaproteobacteria bacterium]